MNDIEKRAHDFAIAAVNAYQSTDNAKHIHNNSLPKYLLNNLIEIYCKAYDAMEAELSEKQYQSEL